MNLDALKEKLRDQWNELWGRIQENSLYMSLREKFEALSARAQALIITASSVMAALFFLSFPYSYISSSQNNIAAFEQNRELIRGLLKASRSVMEISPLPPGMPIEALTSEVNRALDEFHLMAEQITPIQPLQGKITHLIPDGLQQVGVSLQLKKLNLTQATEISHRLQTMNPGIKLMGLDIRENKSSHYFDVVYKLANFSVPEAPVPGGKMPPRHTPQKPNSGNDDE